MSPRPPRLSSRAVAAALLDLDLPAGHAVGIALTAARPDVARAARREAFRRFCQRHAAAYEGATTDLVLEAARLVGVSDATAWRWWATRGPDAK